MRIVLKCCLGDTELIFYSPGKTAQKQDRSLGENKSNII